MEENKLMEMSQELLLDARSNYENKKALSVPIAELSTLGAGVASLLPAFRTVTQTTSIPVDGLFRVANAGVGDVLKAASDGTFWGALKTAEGGSRMAQLQAAGPMTASTATVAAFNPAIMMMAVALFSIEQDLKKIENRQKQILDFLRIEKESKIEGDIETLMGIVRNYKQNWDNERFVADNHKLVLDIQRTARANMIEYQKLISKLLGKKHRVVAQNNAMEALYEFDKTFNYYHLSLYNFAIASLMEIMLSGNFKESYIIGIRDEIQGMNSSYRSLFHRSSHYLEKIGKKALEARVFKGIGAAGKGAGKIIGDIPFIKEGPLDELLQEKGSQIMSHAISTQKKPVHKFAHLGNPGTGTILARMEDMIQIYNHTEQICFDDRKIYLFSNDDCMVG